MGFIRRENEREVRRAAAEKRFVLFSVVLDTDLYATNEELIEAVKQKSQGSLDALTQAYIDQIRFDEGLNGVDIYKKEKLVVDVINLHRIDHDTKQVLGCMRDLNVFTPDPIIALYMYLQASEFDKYSSPIIVPCDIADSLMVGDDGRPLHVKVYLSENGKLAVMECRHGIGDWAHWFYNAYHFHYAYPRHSR